MTAEIDLFGAEIAQPLPPPPNGEPRKRGETPRRGYAAQPGSGPANETCRSYIHSTANQMANTYWKCALMRDKWTGGRGTDIVLKSPACSKWEGKNGVA